jgi:hypothetical protein
VERPNPEVQPNVPDTQERTKELERPRQSKIVPIESDRNGSTRQVALGWRKLAVISAGAALGAVVGIGVWYYNRHAPPKPYRLRVKRAPVAQQDIESSPPTVYLL